MMNIKRWKVLASEETKQIILIEKTLFLCFVPLENLIARCMFPYIFIDTKHALFIVEWIFANIL